MGLGESLNSHQMAEYRGTAVSYQKLPPKTLDGATLCLDLHEILYSETETVPSLKAEADFGIQVSQSCLLYPHKHCPQLTLPPVCAKQQFAEPSNQLIVRRGDTRGQSPHTREGKTLPQQHTFQKYVCTS